MPFFVFRKGANVTFLVISSSSLAPLSIIYLSNLITRRRIFTFHTHSSNWNGLSFYNAISGLWTISHDVNKAVQVASAVYLILISSASQHPLRLHCMYSHIKCINFSCPDHGILFGYFSEYNFTVHDRPHVEMSSNLALSEAIININQLIPDSELQPGFGASWKRTTQSILTVLEELDGRYFLRL